MAKRGETRPWKMIYTWPAHEGRPSTTGTQAFSSQDEAEMAADKQRQYVSPHDGETQCEVVVAYRPTKDRK